MVRQWQCVLAACAVVALSNDCPPPSPSAWMEEMWTWIKDKQIVDLMMPGSHNAGADLSMRHVGLCPGPYNTIKNQIKDAAGMLRDIVTDNILQQYLQPWQVNQYLSIYDQMHLHGVRYLHLKACNFANENGNDRNGPFDLNHVYHHHGGFTSMTLASIFDDVLMFLDSHPLEFAVVAVHNPLEVDNLPAFAEGIAQYLSPSNISLVRTQDWTSTLDELAAANRRLVVMVDEAAVEGVLPKYDYLIENWNEVIMTSDNFTNAREALEQDAIQLATFPRTHTKFYVMPAHPAKNTDGLTTTEIFAQSAEPMLDFMKPFFEQQFPGFVDELIGNYSSLVINGISTDFVNFSGSFELAMRIQRFCFNTTTTTATRTSTLTTTSTVTDSGLAARATALSGGLLTGLPLWALVAFMAA